MGYGVFTANQPFESIETTVSTEARAVQQVPIQALSPEERERESQLVAARRILLQKAHFHQKAYYANQPKRGKREVEYRELRESRKNRSLATADILAREVPVPLSEFSSRRLYELSLLGSSCVRGDNRTNPMQFFCGNCGHETHVEFMFACASQLYCALCVPTLHECKLCMRLKSGCSTFRTFDGSETTLCTMCMNAHSHCRYCDEKIGREYMLVRACAKHLELLVDERPTSQTVRSFSKGVSWVSKTRGSIVTSQRVFSCELEALTPKKDWPAILGKNVAREVGIATDGSVNSHGEKLYGFEVQTPKLAGAKGEELVRHLIAGVKKMDAVVNSSCGMHVHLDGAGITKVDRADYPKELLQLWKLHIVFEDVILSFLPFSRRRNDYCRPLAEFFSITELDDIESWAEAEKLWYQERDYSGIQNAKGHRWHASRYFGANFHSLFTHGHFEVRFHSGTLNAKKVLEWVNLHSSIMDGCTAGVFDHAFFTEAMATYRIADKTKLLFDKLHLAPASRQYFRARQTKFGNKKTEDEETRKSKLPQLSLEHLPTTNPRRMFMADTAPTSDMVPLLRIPDPPQLTDTELDEAVELFQQSTVLDNPENQP